MDFLDLHPMDLQMRWATNDSTDLTWLLAIVPFLSAGIGAYLGSYLKKKGENLATHEDISKLVDQVSAVTKATKEIEAKISSDLWNRQKQWELRREMILDVSKAVSEMEDVLILIQSTLQVRQEPEDAEWMQSYYKTLKRWRDACGTFDRARMLVAIACSPQTASIVGEYGRYATTLSAEMTKNKNAAIYDQKATGLQSRYLQLGRALRQELRDNGYYVFIQ
jgi:hypothetical protein